MLNLGDISREMADLDDWSLETDTITKVLMFDNFKQSIDFVNKVSEIAEKHNHHPEIIINYDQVKLMLTTHTESGLTKKDFEVAREVDKIVLGS